MDLSTALELQNLVERVKVCYFVSINDAGKYANTQVHLCYICVVIYLSHVMSCLYACYHAALQNISQELLQRTSPSPNPEDSQKHCDQRICLLLLLAQQYQFDQRFYSMVVSGSPKRW